MDTPFADGRSTVAQRYRVAKDQTKPQMAQSMIARAQRSGVEATYLLADAWFGTKQIIAMAQDALLIPIVRMKKSTMKYRYTTLRNGQRVERDLDVAALYQVAVRGQWDKSPGQPYACKTVDVQLNLNAPENKTARWTKVRLLFVRGVEQGEKAMAAKHDWVVFLSTDTTLAPERILQLYALRWPIEVYFKEAKQHLGLLQEQARHYASYVASIHLTAMRFCLLVIAKHQHGAPSIAQMRQQICTNITSIDFAARLWPTFRALFGSVLDGLASLLGDALDLVKDALDLQAKRLFVQALQLDPDSIRMERL